MILVSDEEYGSLRPMALVPVRCDECGHERSLYKYLILQRKEKAYKICKHCTCKRQGRIVGTSIKGEYYSLRSSEARRGRFPPHLAHVRKPSGAEHHNYIHDRNERLARAKSRKAYYGLLAKMLLRTSQLKLNQSHEILGYSAVDLRRHLESKFVDGMSWSNRGEWHVDHIKSVARFRAEGITDPRIVCSLENLQPLWGVDNMRKGARCAL